MQGESLQPCAERTVFRTAEANEEAGQAFSEHGVARHLPLSNGTVPTAAGAFAANDSILAEQLVVDGSNWGQQFQQWDGHLAADAGAAANAGGGWDNSQYQQSELPDGLQQWQQGAAAPLTEVRHRYTCCFWHGIAWCTQQICAWFRVLSCRRVRYLQCFVLAVLFNCRVACCRSTAESLPLPPACELCPSVGCIGGHRLCTCLTPSQVEQPFWAQPQDVDGAVPPGQQWERSVDNPTFVETAAAPWAPPASDAVIGPSGSAAAAGKQPASSAEAELPPATDPATVDHSSWQQQQPEQVIDGSDPSGWQPQANGWHAEGEWQGEAGGPADGGWPDGNAQAEVPAQQAYADAPPAHWDPATQQGGGQSQLGEYGQQQQPSQEQYAGLEGWAADDGAQAHWDALQGQQPGALQADVGAQQAYEGWGAAEGQQWQGYEGGDSGQVPKSLRCL